MSGLSIVGDGPASQPFTDHRAACLAVLNSGIALTRKAGQFLGGEAFNDAPMSAAQSKWLNQLLAKAKLPPFEV